MGTDQEFDGAPSSNLYGSDLRPDFIELGYELFLDKQTFGATFLPADIFDPNSDLKQLDGTIDIIQTSSFFHLFDRDTQIRLAKRVVALLKPQKDSLIFGRQVGNVEGGAVPASSDPGRLLFRHNVETFVCEREGYDKRYCVRAYDRHAVASEGHLGGKGLTALIDAQSNRMERQLRDALLSTKEQDKSFISRPALQSIAALE
ncbi:MAG: hypothetical protein Q9165_001996 [Trypethelium subeluteriae]